MAQTPHCSAPESLGEKISKTDWLDLALVASIDGTAHLDAPSYAVWTHLSRSAARSNLRCEIVLIGRNLSEQASKLTAVGADRVFVYDADTLEASAAALEAFCVDYKPAVLAFPSDLRELAEALAARIHRVIAASHNGSFELNRAKDLCLPEDASERERVTSTRPQLVVCKPDLTPVALETEQAPLPELFICYP